MPTYTVVSNTTTAKATAVYVADHGLSNIVNGGAVTVVGTMASSTISGRVALGAGASLDSYLSMAYGGNIPVGQSFAVMLVGQFTTTTDNPKTALVGLTSGSPIRPKIFGTYAAGASGAISASTTYAGQSIVGYVPNNNWLTSGELCIITGKTAAGMFQGSLNGATTVNGYAGDGSSNAASLLATDTVAFGGSPVLTGVETGLAGFAVTMCVVFVGVSPAELNTYIGNNPWKMVAAAATPVAFSGTVPAQSAPVGSAFSLALSSYFAGNQTPFAYSVFSGTLPAGLTLNTSTGTISGTPTTAGSASIVVRATDATPNTANSNSFTITVAASGDTTPPTFTGPLSIGTVTSSSIQVNWPAGSDAVGITNYETSTDGTTWTPRGTGLTYTFTGLTASTSYTLRVRAKDGAGNISTPVLTITQSTSAVVTGTLALGPLKNNTGTLLASETGATVYVYTTAGVLVVTKTAQTSNGSGVMTVSDAAMTAGTTYRVVIALASGAEGMDKVVAV